MPGTGIELSIEEQVIFLLLRASQKKDGIIAAQQAVITRLTAVPGKEEAHDDATETKSGRQRK